MGTRLTYLQKRVARIAATSPELSKTDIARRAGCSRRAVTGYFADSAFIEYLDVLKRQSRPTAIDVAAIVAPEHQSDVLRRVKRLRGTHLPELSRMEELMNDARSDIERFRTLFATLKEGVIRLMQEFAGPEATVEELESKVALYERALRRAGIDTSTDNPEMQPPSVNLLLPPEEYIEWLRSGGSTDPRERHSENSAQRQDN